MARNSRAPQLALAKGSSTVHHDRVANVWPRKTAETTPQGQMSRISLSRLVGTSWIAESTTEVKLVSDELIDPIRLE